MWDLALMDDVMGERREHGHTPQLQLTWAQLVAHPSSTALLCPQLLFPSMHTVQYT